MMPSLLTADYSEIIRYLRSSDDLDRKTPKYGRQEEEEIDEQRSRVQQKDLYNAANTTREQN